MEALGGVSLRASTIRERDIIPLRAVASVHGPEPFTVLIRKTKPVKVLWRQVISETEKKRQFDQITQMKAFIDWCENFEEKLLETIDFSNIYIHDFDMPGPRLLFIKFSTDMKYNTKFATNFKKLYPNKPIPIMSDIVFMRGATVAILMVLRCVDGKDRVVITKQTRVPIGKLEFEEIPAGMMDDSNNFTGTAAKEVEEETSIKINETDLKPLIIPPDSQSCYPSPGGCDEEIRFYLYSPDITYTLERIQQINGKKTGALDEGESITVKVVTMDELRNTTKDMKTLTALYLYDKRMAEIMRNSLSAVPIQGQDILPPRDVATRLEKEIREYRMVIKAQQSNLDSALVNYEKAKQMFAAEPR
jgi:ADP-sugar diphosphatase